MAHADEPPLRDSLVASLEARSTTQDMATPVIGVTGTARRWSPSWWCIRLALMLTGSKAHRISVVNPDIPQHLEGFIISGGDDIHPDHYIQGMDEESDDDDFDVERDQLEITCINHALTTGKPILGICRGAQLINIVRGGNLHQDINPMRKRTSRRAHLSARKPVRLEPGSRMAQIVGTQRLKVNSLREQAVDRLGDDLTCVGRDLDGITQAIESPRDIVGVQWHPEYLLMFRVQRRIFRWLAEAVAERNGG
ncbi:MAG: gamma-glutamyl-gamma-aminobutyrate hydrolase family protein [Gammaproteobacteria bacterium]|nr:gamma-glutamyl-gamma-aminobutyrate hydrolase family protein [Gammaproteobacteria bacterium]